MTTRCTPGQVGPRGNEVATGLAREADVILALGTRLGFNTTFYTYDHLNRDARIIQVELEPTAIGRFFRSRWDPTATPGRSRGHCWA